MGGLRGRLLSAFGVLALISTVGGLAVWLTMQRMEAQMLTTRDRFLPQTERIADVKTGVVLASLEARHAMLAPDDAGREAALQRLLQARASTDRLLAALSEDISTAKGRELFAEVERHKQAFWRQAEALLPLIRAGDQAAAFARLEAEVVPARDRFIRQVEQQRQWQAQLLAQSTERALALGQRSERLLLAVSLLGLLVGLAFAWRLSRELLGQLGGEPRQAVAAVVRVADGDLTTAIAATGRPDSHSVLGAIDKMQQALRELLARIGAGVDQVSTAASQIAAGNAELSSRTEQQASALQQAAASLQQLSEAVQRHLATVQDSRSEAVAVAQAARQGGDSVQASVAEMDRVRANSQRMVDIIGTIDGIAFQTNILALNAAVEAARAGESGRGFAVVASEVRALAQRSAQAAQAVKQLIQANVTDIAAAHARLDGASAQVLSIVQGIERLNEHMGHIDTAIRDQAAGLQEVNGAVHAVDDATQRNAALVEQSAAASASLHEQARQLEQAARRFRLPAPAPVGG